MRYSRNSVYTFQVTFGQSHELNTRRIAKKNQKMQLNKKIPAA